MKTILFFVLTVLSFNTFADTYEIKCLSPFNPNTIDSYSTDVKVAYSDSNGTRIEFRDGTIIKYSISVKCMVTIKEQ